MKTYTIVAAGLLLASVSASGQPNQKAVLHGTGSYAVTPAYNEAYVQKAVKTYATLLNSDNDGVVASAIAHLALIKIDMPDVELDGVRAKIADLVESGRTPAIRYKAYLASIVFQTPEMFRGGSKVGSTVSDTFFREIASRAQTSLLGQNLR